MNDEQYKRLEPFFTDKRARQRLILFLIAKGYTVRELVKMKTEELRALKLPVEMTVCRDEVLADMEHESAFTYPKGKPLPHTYYYRLLRMTANKVIGRPMSQEMFRAYILTGKKGGR